MVGMNGENEAMKALTIKEALSWAREELSESCERPQFESELFLAYHLKKERTYLLIHENESVEDMEAYKKLIQRRAANEPYEYIVGSVSFYDIHLEVDQNVLIPRPETEILIERIKTNGSVNSLLDIGTGTGCIAITVGLENLADKIFATDISESTIEIAKDNMKLHQVENIRFAHHDFLKQNFKTKFDVVISNPPYIGTNEMNTLQAEVQDYDPPSALTDNGDGLSFYHRFAERFENLLNIDGYLLPEFGGNAQKQAVESIFQNAGLKIEFFKDLQNDWRIVEVRR